MRRLADASYWIYLAHLPLVIVLQWMLVGVALPAPVKVATVCATAMAILLLADARFVRGRWIGRQLGGSASTSVR